MAPQHYQQAHNVYPVNTMAAAQMQLHSHVPIGHGQNPYHYNPATPTWANANDPTILNNFWDDMMWDTNLPDMLETPFGLSNEYDYSGTGQDASGTTNACWMNGN